MIQDEAKVIEKLSKILELDIEDTRQYLAKNKTYKKFKKWKEKNEKEDKTEVEVEPQENSTKTKFLLDKIHVNTHEVFRLWFQAIGDTKQEQQIVDFIEGRTKSRLTLKRYLHKAKIVDIEMFVVLFNIITNQNLEITGSED